ncbi:Mu transposase C-terminal domain-containing protein [Pseudarthrobacter sp. J1763]|uniref:Mu transposase C-terminal domain-containing protein n=1 Tax=Pseudarthrobacter sp. J1763 TaxID=3420445 RepID=UPI003D29750D
MPSNGARPEPASHQAREETAANRWDILARHINGGQTLVELANESGVGLRTLQRWKNAYAHDGIAGLLPARPARRDSKIHPQLVAFIERCALQTPVLSIAQIYRDSLSAAEKNGWPTVSYGSVRSIVQNLDPAMRTLALQGPVAYRDKYELVWRHRAEAPNAVWQADHTELDILILDANQKPARPWLTVILDDYSRAVCGYMVFLGAPSAIFTALALRDAIWPSGDPVWPMCGIPDRLYVDHGTDFTSLHLSQVAKDLNFEIVYSAVARPQGRGKIERIFGTVNTELLPTLPGHLIRGKPSSSPKLTLKELDSKIESFITEDYHQRTHPETKVAPTAAWLSQGWLPRIPESIDDLNLLLLTVAKSRMVHRDGVHFQGLRYISPLLAAYVREQVTIRYDPRDISEIRVFYRDSFICKAVDPEHESSTVTLKDIQAARNARKRELRNQINLKLSLGSPTQANTDSEQAPLTSAAPSARKKLRTYQEGS